MPDVIIGVKTTADVSGLTAATAAVKDHTRAVESDAAVMAAANAKAKEIDVEMQARMQAERSTGTSTRSGTPGYHPPAESSGEIAASEQMRNVMERKLEINKLLIAGEYAQAEALKQEMAVEVQAFSLRSKGIGEEEAYALATKHVAAEVAAAKAQEAVAAKAAADAEAKALAEKLAKQEAAAARQAEIQAARLAKQAEAEAAADAATAVSAAKANSMADLKILRDSAMASGQVELADAYQFQISVTKEAQALMAKGVGVQQAYVTATAMVSEADRLEAVEAQKAAAAKLEKAAAARVAAGAEEGEAAATHLNTTAMREAMVISRELMSGNISRLPGSAGLLAANMGFASALPAILGVSVALMAGHELWKTYRKGVQDTKDELVEFKREAEHAAFALDMAVNKAKDSAAKFYDELDRIVTKAQSITEAMQQLNKAQEEAAHLDEAIAKTRETAALANAKEIKDPVARAQAEYAAKNEEIRRGEEEADKAGRLKFKNAEDGAKAAGAAMEAQIAQVDKLSDAMQKAEATLGKSKSDKSEQDKALARFRKLGLNEEQIEAIMSGKSLSELTGMHEGPRDTDEDTTYGRLSGRQGAIDNAPIKFEGMPWNKGSKYNEFANVFAQFSGALGGQAPNDQDARVEKAQHDFDTIQTAYNDAASKAKSLGEEFNKLETQLKVLGEELNAQSALRNQNGRDAQIKNLEELRTSYETLLKNLEDKFKDKQAPQSVLDKDAELRHAIAGLTAAMNQLAGMPGAGSTAFQGFSHGHALGPGGVVPQFDFSEFDNVVSKMRDAFQKQLDDALRRVSKTFDHQASQIASATAS